MNNPLDEIVNAAETDALWAKTEPLTDDEIATLIRRQRAIRSMMARKSEPEPEEWA